MVYDNIILHNGAGKIKGGVLIWYVLNFGGLAITFT